MQEILQLVSLAQAIRESLEIDFGTSFAIWSEQDVWQPLNACDFSEKEVNLTDRISKLLRKHPIENTAKTFIFSSDQQVLALPIKGTTAVRLLVVGIIGTHDLALARALADTTLRATRQALQTNDVQARLNQSLVQITADFEELSWLRSLSVHFKDYDVRNGIDQVCGSVIPALIQLIDAETIALYGTPSSLVHDENYPLLYCCGESTLPNEFLQACLKRAVENEVDQAVVWNASNSVSHGEKECPVENYILVPLQNGSKHFGWLVALNKVCSPQLLAAVDSNNCDRNCYEFGTGEAGLMRTLALMLATHGRNNELYREKEALLVGVIQSLVNTIDAKDAYTCGHSDRVASISKRIAREMGFSDSECEQVHMAGLLHDIGKIGVPDTVLGKPEELSEDEFKLVRKHPTIGFDILKHLKPLEYALPGVLYHHETMDGQGYPFGLIGEQIPLLGRIIAVADSYDAMTSDRNYRRGLSTVVAEDVLLKGSGSQWDGVVIDAFFAARADIHAICGTARTQPQLTCLPCDALMQNTATSVN
jgi:HD-GYP domain-containing protein (c-di-GMP phosphodiesterase class II)